MTDEKNNSSNPEWVKRLPSQVQTVGFGLLIGFLGCSSVAISWLQFWIARDNVLVTLYAVLCLGIAVWNGIRIHKRVDTPMRTRWCGAAIGVFAFNGPWVALAALSTVVRRESQRLIWQALGVATVTCMLCVLRAMFPLGPQTSLLAAVLGDFETTSPPPWPVGVLAVVLPVIVAVVVGSFARVRTQRARAEERNVQLDTEIARKNEHELIAREIHDVLGHRLSLIDLQAGALEATNPEDPRFAEGVRSLRENATRSMADLRSILNVIGAESRPVNLAQLVQIVEESTGANQLVNSSVFLSSAEDASEELARAVVRIVQEIMTNARKHAPDQVLHLKVSGGPAAGIEIIGRNRVDSVQQSHGEHRGIVGMEERAKSLGGSFTAGIERQEFVIRVALPWK